MYPFLVFDTIRRTDAGAAAIRRQQSRRLRRMCAHAYARVPYYRRLFDEAGVHPEEIRTAEDLQRIPPTTRATMQQVPVRDRLAEGMDPEKMPAWSTSGATGRPLEIRTDPRDAALNDMLSLRMLWRYGLRPWHRKMALRSKRVPVDDAWHARLGLFRRGWLLVSWPPEQWIRAIREFRPRFLVGYSTTLRTMAQYLVDAGITGLGLRTVVATSETLDDASRDLIRRGFEAPVRDVYASWEGGIMAWECPACHGYHVNADWLVLEVVRDGKPVAPGEEGEVVVTNLHTFGMPFIRYVQGDLVARHPGAPACQCKLPRLSRVSGRISDMIHAPDGRLLSPHPFLVVVSHLPGLTQWRLIQETTTRFQIEAVPNADYRAADLAGVQRKISQLIDAEAVVDLVRRNRIEADGTHKFRKILSRVGTPESTEAGTAGPPAP